VCAGGCSTIGSRVTPEPGGAARLLSRLVFRRGAWAYAALTDTRAWRDDCAALAALLPTGRILDLGTGPGTASLELARASPKSRITGLDLSYAMLARARRHARDGGLPLSFVQGDALRLPFADATFDGAAGHSVLYLLPDPLAALGELLRVVRPGGRIAFLEPRAGAPDVRAAAAGGVRFGASMALWRVMSGLHRRFDEAAARRLLEAAGFSGTRAWPVLAGCGLTVTAERPGSD
jgi:ubiquinone/menaquinone biosynthesis C-methylase UbiE